MSVTLCLSLMVPFILVAKFFFLPASIGCKYFNLLLSKSPLKLNNFHRLQQHLLIWTSTSTTAKNFSLIFVTIFNNYVGFVHSQKSWLDCYKYALLFIIIGMLSASFLLRFFNYISIILIIVHTTGH
jgi:hypothetical protein